ncbi:MAG: hypothetical protein KJZ84_00245 [Bryobacteraceae bacterium]|nr:hypothetical protein [Bryobacteraceae bacterium]
MNTLATEFQELLAGRPAPLELDEAALEIARLHNPGADTGAALATLDRWAGAIQQSLPPAAGGLQYLDTAHRFLFGEIGLRGDRETYFAAENSCLDQVIARRRGLPLTLSVVYIEIARRLLRPIHGIGLPGHFVCQYNDGLVNVVVDVFHEGALLAPGDALALVEALTGRPHILTPSSFQPASRQSIVLRMLRNLRNAYQQQGDAARVRQIDSLLRPRY